MMHSEDYKHRHSITYQLIDFNLSMFSHRSLYWWTWWRFQSFQIVQFFQFCGLKQDRLNNPARVIKESQWAVLKPAHSGTLTIVFDLLGHVIIHYMLYSWEIQTLRSNICSNQYILLPLFECFYGFCPFLLIWETSRRTFISTIWIQQKRCKPLNGNGDI